ncbi:MAG TPA: hypothetical protein VMU99_07325 [Acidimicrobiales bacterium]|nr:hypothetical protein [Acidimicrobiales bacterium]
MASNQVNTGGCSKMSASGISDKELSELALEADPNCPIEDDANPLRLVPAYSSSLLGAWYMPPPATRRVSGWRLWVMLSIVGILLLLEALGLCSVFGQVVIG